MSITQFKDHLTIPLYTKYRATRGGTLRLMNAKRASRRHIRLITLIPIRELRRHIGFLFNLSSLLGPSIRGIILLVLLVRHPVSDDRNANLLASQLWRQQTPQRGRSPGLQTLSLSPHGLPTQQRRPRSTHQLPTQEANRPRQRNTK